jgi:hypothetical protein
MTEPTRMVDRAKRPTPAQVRDWIGERNHARWTELTDFIHSSYPGVFEPEWLFGGQKHGWYLRFKKSKAFCSLIPERGQFKALLVFGAAEREEVEPILPQLASHVRDDYTAAPTYHDGKWMAPVVDSAKVLREIERLLVLKRRPKPSPNASSRRSAAPAPK